MIVEQNIANERKLKHLSQRWAKDMFRDFQTYSAQIYLLRSSDRSHQAIGEILAGQANIWAHEICSTTSCPVPGNMTAKSV